MKNSELIDIVAHMCYMKDLNAVISRAHYVHRKEAYNKHSGSFYQHRTTRRRVKKKEEKEKCAKGRFLTLTYIKKSRKNLEKFGFDQTRALEELTSLGFTEEEIFIKVPAILWNRFKISARINSKNRMKLEAKF